MKYSQAEAAAILEKIGVARWDFLPPQEGKLKFFNAADQKVGEGEYQLILSYGPDERYTMAWAIDAYKPFPVAAKLDEAQERVVSPALLDDAMIKALEIGEALGADFVYKASTIYVAVFNFTEVEDGRVEENISQEERLRMMREDLAKQKGPS